METQKSDFSLAVKGGRCWNGAHRDRGQVAHYVPNQVYGGAWHDTALCSTKPGRTSYGWTKVSSDPNHYRICAKCSRKYEVLP